jgi:hypothetical protein
MEPQQAAQPQHDASPVAHHPLFTVKFVLRQPPREQQSPAIVMDTATPEIIPPLADSVPAMILGALHRDPNMIVCYGWGCENDGR